MRYKFSLSLCCCAALRALVPTMLWVCLSLFATTQMGAQTKQINRLKNQSSTLQKQLKDSERLLNVTKKDVGTQLHNLNVLNEQVALQEKHVNNIHQEVSTLGNNLTALESQLALLQREHADRKRKYNRAVLYMFRNRMAQSKWMFILSSKNFTQMFRRLRYVAYYSKFQSEQAKLIKAEEARIQAKKDEIMGVKREKNERLAEQKKQQSVLQEKQAQQKLIIGELQQRQSELQKTIAKQRQRQATLNAQIDRLIQKEIAAAEARRKAEEARRKAEEKRRAELAKKEAARKAKAERRAQATAKNKKQKAKATASSRKADKKTPRAKEAPAQSVATYRAPDDSDSKLSGSFAANRGRLPVPITGSYAITARFGQYHVPGLTGVTLDNKGINLTGQAGAQARAVFDGEVTAVFSIAGLYNIIVRHGAYMSVYCNLRNVSVRQGQRVTIRQTLGAVAPDASGNYTLQFQLRKETQKLNPQTWIGR